MMTGTLVRFAARAARSRAVVSIGDQDGAVIPAFGQDRVQDTVFCDGLDKLRCRVEVDLVADVVTDLEGGGIDGEQFGGGVAVMMASLLQFGRASRGR